MLCKDELLPADDMEAVTDACKALFEDETTSLVEKLFDTNTRISQAVFKQQMFEEFYYFLQPHRIR